MIPSDEIIREFFCNNALVAVNYHSDKNKNVLTIYHSGVDMQHSLTFALIGAHQRAIT